MAAYWRAPAVSSRGLVSLLQKYFPFDNVQESSVVQLDGYDDRNYKFSGQLKRDDVPNTPMAAAGNWFVAKFLNSRDSKDVNVVDGLVDVAKFVYTKAGIKCPYPIPSLTGYEVVRISHNDLLAYTSSTDSLQQADDAYYCLRVFVFIEGKVLGYDNHSPELLHELGKCMATVDKELMALTHEGLAKRRFEEWNLKYLLNQRKQLALVVKDPEKVEVLSTVMDNFETHVLPVMDKVESGCIHGDFNALNIIVNNDDSTPTTINGIIDLSDCVFVPHVFDLGICLSYTMARRSLRGEDPVHYVKPIIDGYLSVHPLSKESLDILYYVILGRAAQSLINSFISYEKEPTNEYLLIDSKPLWHLMNFLLREGKEKIDDIWGIK